MMKHCNSPDPCYADGVCRYTGECDRQFQTNADRIRSMSDEELAQYLAILMADTRDGVAYSTDEDRWFVWLQQPAEECE